jgi:hypothetical protein
MGQHNGGEVMGLMKPTEEWAMTAEGAALRSGYADRAELRLRNAMEALLRQRHPEARMCHEMMMGEREVRADLVAVSSSHIAAVEIKGDYDKTTRLLHQVGMYQLCVPEVWIVTAKQDHGDDAELIRWLIPSIGVITGTGFKNTWHRDLEEECVLTVIHEPVPRQPVPRQMLEMMWAQELANIVSRTRLMSFTASKIPARAKSIAAVLEALSYQEILTEVCTELRARQALWRADPPTERNG